MIPRECANPACRRTTDGAPICGHCELELAERLRGVPHLLDDLLVALSRQARVGAGGKRTSRAETPLPFDWDTSDLISALGNTLTTWARDLTPIDRYLPITACPPARYARDPIAASICIAAATLAHHIAALHQSADAAQVHDEITSVLAACERACSARPLTLFVGPCDVCGADLRATPETTSTRCRACGTPHHNLAARWDAHVAALRERAATATEIARYIGAVCGVIVRRATISKWHQRGRLEAVHWVPREDESDGPRFLVGAVLDLAARSDPRKAG